MERFFAWAVTGGTDVNGLINKLIQPKGASIQNIYLRLRTPS